MQQIENSYFRRGEVKFFTKVAEYQGVGLALLSWRRGMLRIVHAG